MNNLIAIICLGLAAFLYWKVRSMDHDPNIPGAVSHVILPAAIYPFVLALSIIGLLAYFYRIF